MIEIKDKLILKPHEIGNDGLPLSGGVKKWKKNNKKFEIEVSNFMVWWLCF